MFVVSEERHKKLLAGTEEWGKKPPDAGAHGNAHEISHFWWHVADTTTQHDWINEASAEYSAALDSRRRGGVELYGKWARHYADELAKAAPPAGILGTTSSDKHRYVVWYQRGALFFMCSEIELGEAAIRNAQRALLALGRKRRVTTDDLLAAMRAAGATEAWLDEWLRGSGREVVDRCLSGLGVP